jgi:hypothetical protein
VKLTIENFPFQTWKTIFSIRNNRRKHNLPTEIKSRNKWFHKCASKKQISNKKWQINQVKNKKILFISV